MKRRQFMKMLSGGVLSIPFIADAKVPLEAPYDSSGIRVGRTSKSEADITGMLTSIDHIDDISGGLRKGQLIVIAARPSMGKSTLIRNIIQNIVTRYGVSAGYCDESIAYHNYLDDGNLRIRDLDMAHTNRSRYITLKELHSCVSVWKRNFNIGILAIDSLQNIYTPNNANNLHDETQIIPFLKEMAEKYDIPVVVTTKVHADIYQREDKRPKLYDLNNYRVFDDHANIIAFLYRAHIYEDDIPDCMKNAVEIMFEKCESGWGGSSLLALKDSLEVDDGFQPERYYQRYRV